MWIPSLLRFAAVLLLMACCMLSPFRTAKAQAGVQRCVGPGGQLIYTDKPCAAFGATNQQPRRVAPSGASVMRPGQSVMRPGCARTIEDVLHEIIMAFDTQDPNRLVGVYHWPGQDTKNGYLIANRLQQLASQPLVDAQLTGGNSGDSEWREGPDGELVPVQRKARGPTGVRVQTAKGRQTPTTQFSLRRNADCWWISY